MKSRHSRRLHIALFLFVAVDVGAQQRATIPQEVARLRPEPVRVLRVTEVADVPVDELFQKGDIIVHGIASITGTRLSDDQTAVYTDFIITPNRIFRQRVVARAQRPGAVEPLAFTQWGGKMLYDGVVVECVDQDVPLVDDGAEGIFFLTLDQRINRYRLVRDAGALNVKGNRIVPLLASPVLDGVRGKDLAEMLREVAMRTTRSR